MNPSTQLTCMPSAIALFSLLIQLPQSSSPIPISVAAEADEAVTSIVAPTTNPDFQRLRITSAPARDCVKTLDLVFCQGDFRGDEGEAFCRGPGPSPAHAAARMFGRLR